MSGPLRILIVDDSITYRSIMNTVLDAINGVTVISTASNGKSALLKLEQNEIDIVLLDIEMPEMDGLQTLQEITRLHPGVGVVMVSGTNRSSADITIQALQLGALDFIPKPDYDSVEQNIATLRQRLVPIFETFEGKHGTPTVKLTAPAEPVVSSRPEPATITPPPSSPNLGTFKADVIAIGVSTGGPNALIELIPNLPSNLGVPILLVQHMPPVFTASLASNLDKKSPLTVKEGAEGDVVQPNTVYIAPGGKHMVVREDGGMKKLFMNEDPPENSCRPAVDVLFRSIADVYGTNVLCVIMTGMGNDGALGVQKIKTRPGNVCLTQTADTCVVYGMPRAADEMNLSDERVPLNQLAARITSLVNTRSQTEAFR